MTSLCDNILDAIENAKMNNSFLVLIRKCYLIYYFRWEWSEITGESKYLQYLSEMLVTAHVPEI